MTTVTDARPISGGAVAPSTIRSADGDAAELFDELAKREGAVPKELADFLAQSDGLTLIFAIQVLTRDAQVDLGKDDIAKNKEELTQLFDKIRAAIKEAEKASRNKGFFGSLFDKFGAVAKLAVAVAAVASVVATGGASLVAIAALAGTLLSMFSKDIAKAAGGSDFIEKFCTYGGMALSIGAGGVGLAQSLSSAGTVAVGAAQGANATATAVTQAATYVQAGATAGQAVTGYARDRYAADELEARADEREARADRANAFWEMNQFIEFIRNVEKAFAAAARTLTEAAEAQASGTMMLTNNLGGRV